MKALSPLSHKSGQPIAVLYQAGVAGMLLIVLLVCFGRSGQPGKQGETYKDISGLWSLDESGTQPVDFKALGTYMDDENGVVSVYYRLPAMDSDSDLVFRSKDVRTRVLADGDLIYETSVYESRFYNRSPGNLWNVVPVKDAYSGSCLELQVSMVYDTGAVTVDSLYFGEKADIIFGLILDNLFGIFVSLLLVLSGLIMIVADLLPAYAHAKKHHSMAWVGVFAVFTGIWSLIETNMLQFFVKDMRILQLINNMIMIVDSMPLWLYLNSEYEIFRYRAMRIMGYIDVFYILLSVAVQFSGIMDLHYMIRGAIILMAVFDAILYIWIIYFLVKLKKEKKPVINCALQLSGLCALWIFGMVEVYRSVQADRIDRAGLVRVGMLVLCCCFAVSSQLRTYKLLEQGMKYDLISRLAYSDGLTGLGNRTAYLEKLDEFVNNAKGDMRVGVVYLDVNNLKKVNDSLGHDCGDLMIKEAANTIEGSFGRAGKPYRIGGDEFCVLLCGEHPEKMYHDALEVFLQRIDDVNKGRRYNFELQIAQGFAVCGELTRENIDRAVSEADAEMYKNKMMLKNSARMKSGA